MPAGCGRAEGGFRWRRRRRTRDATSETKVSAKLKDEKSEKERDTDHLVRRPSELLIELAGEPIGADVEAAKESKEVTSVTLSERSKERRIDSMSMTGMAQSIFRNVANSGPLLSLFSRRMLRWPASMTKRERRVEQKVSLSSVEKGGRKRASHNQR